MFVRYILVIFIICASSQLSLANQDPALALYNSVGEVLKTVNQIQVKYDQDIGINGETGRGKKGVQMIAPLIIGFKLAGAIIAALTALKILVLKTIFMSSVAMLASLFLAGKYIYEKVKHKNSANSYEAMPYHMVHAAPQIIAQPLDWENMYNFQATSSDVATDLQGHYSNQLVASDNNTYNFIPVVSERKSHRIPIYKTTVYKTTVKKVK